MHFCTHFDECLQKHKQTVLDSSKVLFNKLGDPVRFGSGNRYYCGKFVGEENLPHSSGLRGPNDSPQCDVCKDFQLICGNSIVWSHFEAVLITQHDNITAIAVNSHFDVLIGHKDGVLVKWQMRCTSDEQQQQPQRGSLLSLSFSLCSLCWKKVKGSKSVIYGPITILPTKIKILVMKVWENGRKVLLS